MPIVDVAHQLGVSIEAAKELIREAHAAIAEDLKENLEVNRKLDMARIDGVGCCLLSGSKSRRHGCGRAHAQMYPAPGEATRN
jgi:hypothetical protein